MTSIPPVAVPKPIRDIADDDDRSLAIRFFIYFARFEYALQRTDYASGSKNGVNPDWEKFGQKWNGKFKSTCKGDLRTAWDYFRRRPPKKQILRSNQLDWADALPSKADDSPDLPWLLIMIRRVRNNLFHGGKFQQPVPDASRDQQLIGKTLIVLNACLEYDVRLKKTFHEALDA